MTRNSEKRQIEKMKRSQKAEKEWVPVADK
jgi:hypothetical protein